jgi:hypothetical protein
MHEKCMLASLTACMIAGTPAETYSPTEELKELARANQNMEPQFAGQVACGNHDGASPFTLSCLAVIEACQLLRAWEHVFVGGGALA